MDALEEAISLGYSLSLIRNEPVLDELRNSDRLKLLLQDVASSE
jgi:hypothetical protein